MAIRYPSPSNTVTVAVEGGDYPTIEEGLAALALNGGALIVYPGDYTENNPLIVPTHVAVFCPGSHENTRVLCANNGAGQHGIILGIDTEIFGLQVRDASGAGGSGFFFPAAVHDAELHDCKYRDCDVGFHSQASGANPQHPHPAAPLLRWLRFRSLQGLRRRHYVRGGCGSDGSGHYRNIRRC